MRLSVAHATTSATAAYRRRLAQVVLGGLVAAVAVWLGYAFGRGQSLADVARLYRDQNQLTFTLDDGQFSAELDRTGGDVKPMFRAPDGTLLVDYSDWDYNSSVVVDGQHFDVVRLIPSTSVDYEGQRMVEGLDSGNWILSREVSLDGASATVSFSFLAKVPVKHVQFNMAHDNWYFLTVTPTATGFTATVPHASRQEVESGAVRTPSYEVQVQATTPGKLDPGFAHVSLATSYGVQTVTTQYELSDPPVGQYVPIASERVTWRHL